MNIKYEHLFIAIAIFLLGSGIFFWATRFIPNFDSGVDFMDCTRPMFTLSADWICDNPSPKSQRIEDKYVFLKDVTL